MNSTIIITYNETIVNYFIEYINNLKYLIDKKLLISCYLIPFEKLTVNVSTDENFYICIQSVPDILLSYPVKYVSVVNTEQLTRFEWCQLINKYKNLGITVFDYNYYHCKKYKLVHLPYVYNKHEIKQLRLLRRNSIRSDRLKIAVCMSMSQYRRDILNNLITTYGNAIEITEVTCCGLNRDKQIAECDLLLNIHFDNSYKIYEHLRCDRWVWAGMPVITQSSLGLHKRCYNLDKSHIYQQGLIISDYDKLVISIGKYKDKHKHKFSILNDSLCLKIKSIVNKTALKSLKYWLSMT